MQMHKHHTEDKNIGKVVSEIDREATRFEVKDVKASAWSAEEEVLEEDVEYGGGEPGTGTLAPR